MTRFRRLSAAAAVGGVAVLLSASPAAAHNELRASQPAKGDKIRIAPAEVVLDFPERLNPQFTVVAVTAAGGSSVIERNPRVSGQRAVQQLKAGLVPGTYTVAYRVVSVDGHPVQGSLRFSVLTAPEPSAAGTAPSWSPNTVAPVPERHSPYAVAGTPSDTESGSWVTPVIATAAGLLVMTGLLLLYRRRDRRPS